MAKIIKKGIEYSEKARPDERAFLTSSSVENLIIANCANLNCKYVLSGVYQYPLYTEKVNVHEIYYDESETKYKARQIESNVDLSTQTGRDHLIYDYNIKEIFGLTSFLRNPNINKNYFSLKDAKYIVQENFTQLNETSYIAAIRNPSIFYNQVNIGKTVPAWDRDPNKIGLFNPSSYYFDTNDNDASDKVTPDLCILAHNMSNEQFKRNIDDGFFKNNLIFTELDNTYDKNNESINFSFNLDLNEVAEYVWNDDDRTLDNKCITNSNMLDEIANMILPENFKEYFTFQYCYKEYYNSSSTYERNLKIVFIPKDSHLLPKNLVFNGTTTEGHITKITFYIRIKYTANLGGTNTPNYFTYSMNATYKKNYTSDSTTFNTYRSFKLDSSTPSITLMSSSTHNPYGTSVTEQFDFSLQFVKIKLALYNNYYKFYLDNNVKEPVDAVQEDNMNPVTSNAVWEAMQTGSADTFIGTHAEWDQKTTEEKKAYTIVNFTDDYYSGDSQIEVNLIYHGSTDLISHDSALYINADSNESIIRLVKINNYHYKFVFEAFHFTALGSGGYVRLFTMDKTLISGKKVAFTCETAMSDTGSDKFFSIFAVNNNDNNVNVELRSPSIEDGVTYNLCGNLDLYLKD